MLTSLSDKSKHDTGGTLRFTGVKSRESIVAFEHTSAYAATGYMDFSELSWVTRGVLVEEAGVITRFEAPLKGKDGWIWRASMTGVPGYGSSEWPCWAAKTSRAASSPGPRATSKTAAT